MKRTIILILTLLNFISSRDECAMTNPSSKKDCTDYKLKDEEKNSSGYKLDSCCYYKAKKDGTEITTCIAAKKSGVTSKVIEGIKEEEGFSELSIDCNSEWMKFSLFLIGFLVLLF